MHPDFHHRGLSQRYWQLREQLDAAYTAAVWDSQRIDRIAVTMLSVERALASTPPASSPHFDEGAPHGAPEDFVHLSSLQPGDCA